MALAFLIAAMATPTQAQSVQDFYSGKSVKLIVGSGAGGGSDVLSRIFSKYLTRHIPGNPPVIVQNLPAAGGVIAAQEMYNTQPKDGTVIASVMRTVPLLPLLSGDDLKYDSRKMNWLGSLNSETNVIVVWHTAKAKTIDDVFTNETIVGTSGAGSDSDFYAFLLNKTLGTKFKMVTGYPGGPAIDLAMERGEVEGRVSITWTSLKAERSEWIRDKKIVILAQMGLARNPELKDVPNILEYVKDPTDRQVFEFLFARQEAGRPFVAPPGVPADRVAALRKAFESAAKDPDFLADVKQRNGTIELMTGPQMHALIDKMYAASPEVLAAVRKVVNQKS
jgi:tripartite-type tricarboxylate transporter receptor subunit TctC